MIPLVGSELALDNTEPGIEFADRPTGYCATRGEKRVYSEAGEHTVGR